jgi:hypothetical protein
MFRLQRVRPIVGAVIAAALFVAGPRVSSNQAPPVNVPGIDKPVIVVTGEVLGVESWTSNFYYVLRGAVFVREGAILNIQAGTTIIGESGSLGTLVVDRGGKLMAVGTREQPIVFTSDQPIGARNRGDWGGLIINGRAPVNLAGGLGTGEGDTGVYGGDDPNDSSGILQYVRVEFSGVEFSPDNELNGIAFQGVGRGTVVDYVQAHGSRDDGLEWFGGTVDAKHLVVSNAADDSVDWTFGWTGRVQFVAVTQRGDDADNGIEADGNEFSNNATPISNPQFYNVTLCGDPDTVEGGEGPRAIIFRRGTAFTFRNFLITGFKSTGIQIEVALTNTATIAHVINGTSQLGSGVIWGIPTPIHSSVATFVNSGRFPDVRTNVDPGVSTLACSNHVAPNFQPSSAATLAGGQLPSIAAPADGFFEHTAYIGAVAPFPADNWTTGWTAFPQR